MKLLIAMKMKIKMFQNNFKNDCNNIYLLCLGGAGGGAGGEISQVA